MKKRLQLRSFPMNIAKLLRTAFLGYNSSGCFWTFMLFSNVFFLLCSPVAIE